MIESPSASNEPLSIEAAADRVDHAVGAVHRAGANHDIVARSSCHLCETGAHDAGAENPDRVDRAGVAESG